MAEDDDEEEEDDLEEEQEASAEGQDQAATRASKTLPPALLAAAMEPNDATLLHQAELEAEANGVEHGAFKKQLDAAIKAHHASDSATVNKNAAAAATAAKDEDMRKIMMTGKKQRLYTKMTFSNNAKREEVSKNWRLVWSFDRPPY